MEDCLLSTFKWADFDLIDDYEKPDEELRTARSLVRAGKMSGYLRLKTLREASGLRKLDPIPGYIVCRSGVQ
jgi:hypothetical protein